MSMAGSNLSLQHQAHVGVVRAADRGNGAITPLDMRGNFVVEHWRNGELLNTYQFPNGIVNEGKNKLLNVMFNAQTQITAWFLSLIDNAGFTALAAGDNYDNINQASNGWDEFQSYNDANNGNSTTTRPAWPEDAAASQAITNTSVAIFNVTASGTVKGVFLVGGTNSQTKGDHTASGNFLWATALFSTGDVAVNNLDQLKVTYSVTT